MKHSVLIGQNCETTGLQDTGIMCAECPYRWDLCAREVIARGRKPECHLRPNVLCQGDKEASDA